MPGYRQSEEKAGQVIVRLPAEQKARWIDYAEKNGGYVSVLVRMAVEEFMDRHPLGKQRTPLYADRDRAY